MLEGAGDGAETEAMANRLHQLYEAGGTGSLTQNDIAFVLSLVVPTLSDAVRQNMFTDTNRALRLFASLADSFQTALARGAARGVFDAYEMPAARSWWQFWK